MKRERCSGCGSEAPAREMLDAGGRALCAACAAKAAPGTRLVRMIDPTICARCGQDYGGIELPRLGRLPFCEVCAAAVRDRPYPEWLRYAFLALLALAVLAFVRNGRFFSAYADMVRAGRAAREGRFDDAAARLEDAARLVPESPELKAEAAFLRAIRLMQDDRSTEAVPLLRAYLAAAPGDENGKRVLLEAEIGAAFETGDYDAFLEKSTTLAGKEPGDALAVAGVASAWACKYAATGREEFAAKAREGLEAARRLAPAGDPRFEEYRQRILYRLATREVLSRTEFHRRFPNGWIPEEAK